MGISFILFTFTPTKKTSTMKKTILSLLGILLAITAFTQRQYIIYKDAEGVLHTEAPMITITSNNIYRGGEQYEVQQYIEEPKSKTPKNIILMIGDGMGTSQIFAGMVANGGNLFLNNFKHVGFSRTQAATTFLTDSGAAGTALSSGYKTYYQAIGVNTDTIPQSTMLEVAEQNKMATGLVATYSVTNATPASFIAHQPNRYSYEEIAADFLKTNVDVLIGGGSNYFTNRKDSVELIPKFIEKGYQYFEDIDNAEIITSGKLICLTDTLDPPRASMRNQMLPRGTKTALNILQNNPTGFFLMIEGSQIDQGGHNNSTSYIIEEMLDFDQAIGKVLEFAANDGETLVVITADHETGGFSVIDGDYETGRVTGLFTWGDHTATMVPVFAFGPGADQFEGIMENTEIAQKLLTFIEDK